MAPLHYFDTSAVRTLFPRSITAHRPSAPALTAWIILLSFLFTMMLVTACFTTYCITKSTSQTPSAPISLPTDHKPSVTTAANSNWARKDSNVLWSAYFSDDDLKIHFNRRPSQMLRVFSIGTIESDICPLERDVLPPPGFDDADMRSPDNLPPLPSSGNEDVCSRVAYVQESNPAKNLRTEARRFANFEDISIKDSGSME